MPYREPHRTARAHIIDLEIKKLELRNHSRSQAPLASGEARTTDRRATPPRRIP